MRITTLCHFILSAYPIPLSVYCPLSHIAERFHNWKPSINYDTELKDFSVCSLLWLFFSKGHRVSHLFKMSSFISIYILMFVKAAFRN